MHDDGGGLPAGVESNRLSHGIIGMRQRVRALNGTFKIGSRPGSGTTIEVFIPLPTPSAADQRVDGTREDADTGAPPAVVRADVDALAHPTR